MSSLRCAVSRLSPPAPPAPAALRCRGCRGPDAAGGALRGALRDRDRRAPGSCPASPLAALLLVAVLALLPACGGNPEPVPAPEAAPDVPLERSQLRDRIVAIVEEEAILLSDVQEVIGIGMVARQQGETEEALRLRALQGIIEEQLRFRAAERSGFGQVSVDRIEEQVEQVRSRFPSDEAYRLRLAELGLTEAELGQLLARQLLVLSYVDERLGARVFVSLEDIRRFYEEELVPQLTAQGQPVPPLEEVRERIRDVIKQRRLLEEVERWTRDLLREADVQIFLDESLDRMPPLRARVTAPGD